MKDIGDKLRRCSKDVCRLKNMDHQIIEKVLDGPFVAIVVRVLSHTTENYPMTLLKLNS